MINIFRKFFKKIFLKSLRCASCLKMSDIVVHENDVFVCDACREYHRSKFDKVVDAVNKKIKESDIIYEGEDSDFMMEKLVVTMRDDKVDVSYKFEMEDGKEWRR